MISPTTDLATPVYVDEQVTVYGGDCLDVLRAMPGRSVDAVVTDPPYGLEFMGKEWDSFGGDTRQPFRGEIQTPDNPYGRSPVRFAGASSYGARVEGMHAFQSWCEAWATECLRVLKPGGHLLAFGGTRTWHRLACAIEDAGFEVRDSIAWLYGSGFPKSLDASKAIDKAAGATREVVGTAVYGDGHVQNSAESNHGSDPERDLRAVTAPATPDAEKWQGWGTALKPAHEPIVVARKPLAGTVAANVLAHGTGALNIDGCRVGFASEADERESKDKNRHDFGTAPGGNEVYGDYSMVERVNYDPPGRWPANVVLDGREVPLVRLRDNVPAETERAIREFFDASTDHLPPVQDHGHGPAVAEGPSAVLLPEVLRPMDGRQSDGRAGATSRQRSHAGVAGEDAGVEARHENRPGVVELEGRPAPLAGLHVRQCGDAEPGGAGEAGVDDLKRCNPGTPAGDGAGTGSALAVDGAGTSRQRRQDGQSAGEPGTARSGDAQPRARAGSSRASTVAAGEPRPAGAPLEVLLCYVPDGWRHYFHLTGRHAESQAAKLDRQSGERPAGAIPARRAGIGYGGSAQGTDGERIDLGGGGASRFFYVPKAPTSERPRDGQVAHPTVKPLDLMRWLVRLVTPPGGVVLDPFLGSGTTAEACVIEGFRCVGIEREPDYHALIRARLTKPIAPVLW